jgi:hypothetical protein
VITACMASRDRPDMLAASIASLRDHAARPDLLEILVAYDPDDPVTNAVARIAGADLAWRAPERYGFARQTRYYAYLLEQATGEWLLPTWSDDGRMKTLRWDDKLRDCPAGTIVFVNGNYPGLTCFPAVHADALAAIGRLSPLPSHDTWFEDTARMAGVLVCPGIYVHQERPDLTGCPADQTYLEGGAAWRLTHNSADQAYYREPFITWRAEDAAALRALRYEEQS